MSTHAMIDLETLGTKPDGVVLTLGAIKFNPYTQTEPDKGLYIRLDVDEQTKMGRSVDDGTLEWWGKQDKARTPIFYPGRRLPSLASSTHWPNKRTCLLSATQLVFRAVLHKCSRFFFFF